MRKKVLLIILIFLLTGFCRGQTIEEIFTSLPPEYTPDLTGTARDSLFLYGTYTVPDDNSSETVKVTVNEKSDDYVRIYYSFSTGQSGFMVVELRKFSHTEGTSVVVYSKYGGARKTFDQHILQTFKYHKGKLIFSNLIALPETTGSREFLHLCLRDSLEKRNILMSTSYDLNPEEPNSILYTLNPQTDQFDNWIQTYNFTYTWNGENFEKKKVER